MPGKMKWLAIFVIVLLILVAALFTYRSKSPITIGFVAGLTGKYADLGVDCRRGVELAIAQINSDGGINGRPVKMVAMDDGQDEKTAVAAMKSLLELKPPVIIGHATSSMTMATLPLVNKSQTLLIAPTSSTAELENLDDNFFRTCSVSSVTASMIARFLRKEKNVKRAGVIYDLDNKAYTQSWVDNFRKTFTADSVGEMLDFPFSSSNQEQLLPLIQQIREKQLDTLVMVTSSLDAAMLCQQIHKLGWQVQVAMADWAATEQLINLGGKAVEGVLIQQIFNRKSSEPDYIAFKNTFKRLYKTDPGFGALHAYDATMLARRSIAEQERGETLKEAVLRIARFNGLQFHININPYGDCSHPSYMGQVENGEFVIFGEYR